jgi:hypothetical protein
MTNEPPQSPKIPLAIALAGGTSAAQWARTNGVPEATAYRWGKRPALYSPGAVPPVGRSQCPRSPSPGQLPRSHRWHPCCPGACLKVANAGSCRTVPSHGIASWITAKPLAAGAFGSLPNVNRSVSRNANTAFRVSLAVAAIACASPSQLTIDSIPGSSAAIG